MTEPDWRSEYPFAAHEMSLDGWRYHYLDEGSGPPLLLLHGNPTWSFYWRTLVAALADRYRLIVPDHMGCGLSDKPQMYEYRLARHSENVLRLLDKLRLMEQVTLIAHDWGGAIGLGAATRDPDRFARFVLMNTGAFRVNWAPLRIRVCRMPVIGEWAVRRWNAFARAATVMAVARRDRLSATAQAGLLAPYDSWENRVAIQRFVEDIPLSPRHPSYAELLRIEQALPLLASRPIQLIWGMQDWCFTPYFLERFQEFFPQAEVLRLDDVGHYLVEEAPDRVLAGIERFFEKHPLPPA